ncbi:hypothetical protein CBR_g12899 [Chara braunii]|uniref:Uncharacterized protein n=1 Tax=Chara braunii TaxID=69332 RepID=A0A388KSY8_CHABU|nr:hypothetical protein CBR_g12899 [Chara braunii]|eukprot:GBG73181.1 hypothetical protein CBR_g12899 [Chara braunii]
MMQISLHMGGLREEWQHKFDRKKGADKGKKKAEDNSSGDASHEAEDSDVEGLSNKTEQLVISEKRKRAADIPVGDSPPMVTPAKRTAKRRLHLSCRHPPLKKSPRRTTPFKTPSKKKKIPAPPGSCGKLRYVTDNLRELGLLNMEDLRRICQDEDVPFDGRKMQTILAIAEKRSMVAYGSNEEEDVVGQEESCAEAHPEEDEDDQDGEEDDDA